MKKSLIAALTVSLLFSLGLSAQFNLQAGVSAVVSKTTGIGGELTVNHLLQDNFSIGIGVKPIKFEEHRNVYLPVYGTLKYYYPLSKSRLFASIDPGYGIYSSENVSDGFSDFRRKGAVYLSGGVGIMGNSKLSPYASLHFTKFGFVEQYGASSQYRPISTFAFTAGVVINRPATSITADKSRNSSVPRTQEYFLPVSHTQEYFLRKSRRQRTTGWILLGTGVGLITTGIIVASDNEPGVDTAIPIVFISFPGIISSLVSVPFFISSARNKKRAATFSSAVGFQQVPGYGYKGSAHKNFPALGVKLDF